MSETRLSATPLASTSGPTEPLLVDKGVEKIPDHPTHTYLPRVISSQPSGDASARLIQAPTDASEHHSRQRPSGQIEYLWTSQSDKETGKKVHTSPEIVLVHH